MSSADTGSSAMISSGFNAMFRQPARCSDEVPALRVLEGFPGSKVACHFAEQIAAGELTPASPP